MTSWDSVGKWYDTLVGSDGHYYHQHVIFPKLLSLLALKPQDRILDLGCGQGVLAHHLPKDVSYHGIDVSKNLIAQAPKKKGVAYSVADACAPLPVPSHSFTHAAFILSLQNMEHPDKALVHASQALQPGGILVLVLNHPCFRIPRQSHWQVDENQKLQYRRINRYMTPLQIPIEIRGGKTWTFHHSLSEICSFLFQAHFTILQIEEWISDKVSEGGASKMENFARKEFPLFLTIKCVLKHT